MKGEGVSKMSMDTFAGVIGFLVTVFVGVGLCLLIIALQAWCKQRLQERRAKNRRLIMCKHQGRTAFVRLVDHRTASEKSWRSALGDGPRDRPSEPLVVFVPQMVIFGDDDEGDFASYTFWLREMEKLTRGCHIESGVFFVPDLKKPSQSNLIERLSFDDFYELVHGMKPPKK